MTWQQIFLLFVIEPLVLIAAGYGLARLLIWFFE